jgi:Na+/H+-dicarboxylate symporter
MEQLPVTKKNRFPLYAQILSAVVLGGAFGVFFGRDSAHFLANESLGELGYAIIRLLKILAIPLVFLAIVDTILKTEITGRSALKVIGISLFNVMIAMAIGLLIINAFKPGKAWLGKLDAPASSETPQAKNRKATTSVPDAAKPVESLNPLRILSKLVPNSLLDPFLRNNTLSVILIALLFGFAFRGLRTDMQRGQFDGVESLVEILFAATLRAISYVLRIVPIGVFCLVAVAVGQSGLSVFSTLWIFLATILGGFAIHGLIYYPLLAWVVGGKSPRIYLGRGLEAIVTGFSTNSSLATVPVTLRSLTMGMGISDRSARMSACFATNLNNDGITLYEALTALFLTQAVGLDLSLSAQLFIVIVAIFVSMGIAGIPEAGLIILPLVLTATGFTDQQIAIAVAMIVPVDWFIARLRSAVNVMSDMVVAIVLEKV